MVNQVAILPGELQHSPLGATPVRQTSMIISHRHKFVFLKPRKVAGTSVEVALARHCGEEDIVTPIGTFDPEWDEDQYARSVRSIAV